MPVRDVSKVPAQLEQSRQPGSKAFRTKQVLVVRASAFYAAKVRNVSRVGSHCSTWGPTKSDFQLCQSPLTGRVAVLFAMVIHWKYGAVDGQETHEARKQLGVGN